MTTPECRATYTPVKKAKKPTKKELKELQQMEKEDVNVPAPPRKKIKKKPKLRLIIEEDEEEKKLSLADKVRNALEMEQMAKEDVNIPPPPRKVQQAAAAKPVKAAKKPAAAAAADPEKAAAKALKALRAERKALFEADPEAAKAAAEVAFKAELARDDARREYWLAHPKELEAKKAAEDADPNNLNFEYNASIGIRAAKAAKGKYPPHPEIKTPSYTSEELKVGKLLKEADIMKQRIQNMPYDGPPPNAPAAKKQKYLKEINAPLIKIEKQLYEGYGINVKRDFMDDTVDFQNTSTRNISLNRELVNFKYKNNMKKLREKYDKYVNLVAEYGNKPHNTMELKNIKAKLDLFERENIPDDVSPFGYFLKKYGSFFGEENEILTRGQSTINLWLKGEI
jgi:hypothetical protein